MSKTLVDTELLRQALEAIELNWKSEEGDAVKPLLRAALEQPAVEPMKPDCYKWEEYGKWGKGWGWDTYETEYDPRLPENARYHEGINFSNPEQVRNFRALYTSPPPAGPAPVQEPLRQAMQTVIAAMQADPDYAWSWHCNIAMAYVDAGGDSYTGNQGAARFMKLLANVDPAHELPEQPAPVQEPACGMPTGLGGVLTYTKNGAIGVGGQTIGADGSGEHAVLIYGTPDEAWKAAKEHINTIRRSWRGIKNVMFVLNSDGFTGSFISTIHVNRKAPPTAPVQEPVAEMSHALGRPVILPSAPMLADKQPLYAAPQPQQPAVEPVAWRWSYKGQPDSDKCFPMPVPDQDVQDVAKMRAFPRTVQLLYAAPQPAPVQDSTSKLREMLDMLNGTDQARWEIGFRNIVAILYGPRHSFEIVDVVERVRELVSQQPRKAVKLTDDEMQDLITENVGHGNNFGRVLRAIEAAVWAKLGVTE